MFIGFVGFVTTDFAYNCRRKQTNYTILNCVLVISVVNVGVTLECGHGCINININCNFKSTFAFATINCKNAVRLYLVQRLFVIPVHFVSRSIFCNSCILSFRNNSLCNNVSGLHIKSMNRVAVCSFLTNSFCNNILCSGKCIGGSFYVEGRVFVISLNKLFCFLFASCIVVVGKNKICQGLKAFFCSKHSAGLLLFLKGCPEIFERCKSCCRHNSIVQSFCKLTLGKNPLYNFKTTVFKVMIRLIQMVTVTYLNLIKIIMLFFTITADKRNCTSFLYQTYNSTYLLHADVKLLRNFFHNLNFVDG